MIIGFLDGPFSHIERHQHLFDAVIPGTHLQSYIVPFLRELLRSKVVQNCKKIADMDCDQPPSVKAAFFDSPNPVDPGTVQTTVLHGKRTLRPGCQIA